MSDVKLKGEFTGSVDAAALPEATSSAIGAVKKNLMSHVYMTSNKSISASGIVYLTGFTSINDPEGAWDLTNGLFTAPSDGVYCVSASVRCRVGDGAVVSLRATNNAQTPVLYPGMIDYATAYTPAQSDSISTTSLHGFINLTAGDVVKFAIYSDKAGTLEGNDDYTRFQIVKLNVAY